MRSPVRSIHAAVPQMCSGWVGVLAESRGGEGRRDGKGHLLTSEDGRGEEKKDLQV